MAAELKISYETSGMIENEGTMPLYISADEEKITVSGMTYQIMGKAELPSGESFDFSKVLGGGGTVETGWDDTIWEPWDSTKKTLKFAGE